MAPSRSEAFRQPSLPSLLHSSDSFYTLSAMQKRGSRSSCCQGSGSISSTMSPHESNLISVTHHRPTSAPPDLETNSTLNSVFLSHIAGERIKSSNEFSPNDDLSRSISVEFDLERLICGADILPYNISNTSLTSGHPGRRTSVVNGNQSEDGTDNHQNVTPEQLLVARLAQSRGVALPNFDHIPTSDYPLSAQLNNNETDAIALLRKVSESGLSTAAQSSVASSPTTPAQFTAVANPQASLAMLPHFPGVWKSASAANMLSLNSSVMKGVFPEFHQPLLTNPVDENALLQQYRQQQLLNLQVRMAIGTAGAAAVSSYSNSPSINYIGAKQTTSDSTTELFPGLRGQSEVNHCSTPIQPFPTTTVNPFIGLNSHQPYLEKMGILTHIDCEELVRSNGYSGYVYALAKKDQAGCRVLQKKLDEGDPVHINTIFTECLDHLNDLMTDPFGNYLCQKLVEVVSDDQLGLLLERIATDIPGISLNMHGTRASQALVERACKTDRIHVIINSLRGHVVALVKDLNGNHVIQKCLTALGHPLNQFIYDDLINNCVEVAVHRHGCCVLQRSIDSATPEQRDCVIEAVRRNTLQLVQDAFGNYVVQYVLDLKQETVNDAIAEMVLGNVTALSKQKFASNVVEKCLVLGSERTKTHIIGELLDDGPQRVRDLLLDPFGNYVIQRALHVSREPHFSQLIEVIRGALPQLKQTPSGKRIALKLLKKYSMLSSSPTIPFAGQLDFSQLQFGVAPSDPLNALNSVDPLLTNPHHSLTYYGSSGPLKSLSNNLISTPFYSGTFCSDLSTLRATAAAITQQQQQQQLNCSTPTFPHFSTPLSSLVGTSPSLQAMQEFYRLQQDSNPFDGLIGAPR